MKYFFIKQGTPVVTIAVTGVPYFMKKIFHYKSASCIILVIFFEKY